MAASTASVRSNDSTVILRPWVVTTAAVSAFVATVSTASPVSAYRSAGPLTDAHVLATIRVPRSPFCEFLPVCAGDVGDYLFDEVAQCGQVVEVDAKFFDADLDQTHYLGTSVRRGRTERAGHEIEISARVRLREVRSVCRKVGVEFGDEFDFGMRSADLLAVVHQPLVRRLVDLQRPVPHPSVGLGRSDTHQLWSLAADEVGGGGLGRGSQYASRTT